MRRLPPRILRPTPPLLTLALLAAAASVAADTAHPLGRVGVYLLSVGAVSALWGVRLGAATAVASVLLWDHFQTPHSGIFSFHIPDLLALAMFLAAALLAGSLAELARSRAVEAHAHRQEADLAAELGRLLLRTQDLRSALPEAARRLAQTLELPCAVIELDTVAGDEHRAALPLHDGATRRGTLLVPADLAEPTQRRLRERIVPSLGALLHAAWERQAIGRALETSRDEQRGLAAQQAALRRVATLVARGVSPTQLFATVAGEMGQILDAEFIEIARYSTDRASYTVAGSWTRSEPTLSRPLGSRWPVHPGLDVEVMLRTGRPARIEGFRASDGETSAWVCEKGITSSVACLIVVEGRQWGAMIAFSTEAEPQPADTEERMQEFTKLVATAIANTESRDELRLLAEQQAALRRVATLVARGVSPTQLFSAVAEQIGQLLQAEFTEILRYGTDGTYTVVGSWTRSRPTLSRPLGSRWPIEPRTVVEVLLRTGRPARIRYGDDDGEVFVWLREHGITSVVGCPIMVEGRQWGAMTALSTGTEPQSADTEERMEEFTELVATAIANTESRDELRLLAEQQAALRRVATLVARGVSPTQLFATVAEQMGQILGAEFIEIVRYGTDGVCTVVGTWARGEPTLTRPLGSRWPIRPGIIAEVLLRTGRPARINLDCYGDTDGVIYRWVREQGITSGVGCPIMVEGRHWGAMIAFSTKAEPQPADTEERMQEFTELVATAIANTESRTQLRLLAEQQAALRRVATLVARGVAPTQLFAAVAGEMGQILDAELSDIVRYETAGVFTVVGSWTRSKPTLSPPIGSRWPIHPGGTLEVMLRTGRPARINYYREGYRDGEVSTWLREQGITSAVGCPIRVEGGQWGAMVAFSTRAEPQPADTEERMLEFTELVATAIANTESRTQLISSRARVVAAADQTRRRIERDLHDGTQQRLISLALELSAAQAATPPELDELRAQLSHTAQGLAETVTELQEISRGIHPAILSNGGIGPALKTLTRRSTVPVELTVGANQGRLAEPVEVAAYYIVSEALTNVTKHAHASVVHVNLDVQDTILRLCVRDDGDGGADPNQGSGLTGLRDRIEALNGTIEIASPTGGGTSLTVTIPIHNDLPTTCGGGHNYPHLEAAPTRRAPEGTGTALTRIDTPYLQTTRG